MSVPFRFRYGEVATVDESSDEAHAEMIAVLCRTSLGERHMVPGFGVTDPAFQGLDADEVRLGVFTYGPPVQVTSVEQHAVDESTFEAVVRFE